MTPAKALSERVRRKAGNALAAEVAELELDKAGAEYNEGLVIAERDEIEKRAEAAEARADRDRADAIRWGRKAADAEALLREMMRAAESRGLQRAAEIARGHKHLSPELVAAVLITEQEQREMAIRDQESDCIAAGIDREREGKQEK